MKRFLAVTATSLALVFGLSACENSADIARKPDAAEAIVKNSLKECKVKDSDATYGDRLRSVLMDVRSNNLDVLINNKTTICLDARIDSQVNGTWDSFIWGIYNKKENVVSLLDNASGTKGFFDRDAQDYGEVMVTRIAEKIKDGDVSTAFAYARKSGCGKNCTTVRWYDDNNFDSDSIAKNPQLKTPPLKEQAQTPRS